MRSFRIIEGDLVPYVSLTPAGWLSIAYGIASLALLESRLARSATRGIASCVCIAALLAGCDLSPDLIMPDVFKPASFKESAAAVDTNAAPVAPATDGKWKRFDDKAQIDEFAWWRMFSMPELDALMEQAMKDNPTLDVAAERVNNARAMTDSEYAKLYPTVGVGFGPSRQLTSPASIKPNIPPGTTITTKPYTLYTANATIGWDTDLFGQHRAQARAAAKDADAEQNTYRAARLGLQADLAQTYFRLAALRQENDILQKTLKTREQTLKYTQQKYDVGAIDSLSLSKEEADIAGVQSDAASVQQQVDVAEHALAVLIGTPPSELTVKVKQLNLAPPAIPAGIPSTLLERRPDIKQAADQIAAANERIGVARSGAFPNISLSAMGGFVSGDLSHLFQWSNRSWLIGPLAGTILTQPIFEGGQLAAQRAQADSGYKSAVASYRGSVLSAFGEVEDNLSGIRNAADQVKATNADVAAAKRAYDVAKQRYDVGYSSHLEFLDAERTLLAAQRTKVAVVGNQYITTVELVKALGGSWVTPVKTDAPVAAAAPVAPAPAVVDDAVTPGEPSMVERWWGDVSDSVSDSF